MLSPRWQRSLHKRRSLIRDSKEKNLDIPVQVLLDIPEGTSLYPHITQENMKANNSDRVRHTAKYPMQHLLDLLLFSLDKAQYTEFLMSGLGLDHHQPAPWLSTKMTRVLALTI